jgi:hypothetical protein
MPRPYTPVTSPNVIASGVPVTVNRHIYVSRTDGDTAVAHDDIILEAAGQAVPSNHTYAVDRNTMDAATEQPHDGVEPHSGMTIAPGAGGCPVRSF